MLSSNTRDDRNAVTCLLMDSCDRWRKANGLVPEDYQYTDLEVLHCPLDNTERESEGKPRRGLPSGKTLRYCYAEGQQGFRLVTPVDSAKLFGVSFEDINDGT